MPNHQRSIYKVPHVLRKQRTDFTREKRKAEDEKTTEGLLRARRRRNGLTQRALFARQGAEEEGAELGG